MNVNPMLFYNM